MARKISKLSCISALAAATIPLGDAKEWMDVKFSRISPNKTVFSESGITIAVDRSASPLVHALSKPQTVKGFTAELEIEGLLNPAAKDAFPEDCYLRIGFVVPGSRKLGRLERMMAPDWINQLFKLAPAGSGIEKIFFFNLAAPGPTLDSERETPKAKGLIVERVVKVREGGSNSLNWTYRLPRPLNTAALWLSADGDDSKSSFKLTLRKLTLESD